jgi:hypothetical protein
MFKKPIKSKRAGMQITRQAGPWHAVSIIVDRYCCDAARGIVGRRFLAAEAPRLPLIGCGMREACDCKYKHHGDRRGPPRRKEDLLGLRRREPGVQERRGAKSRRESD